MFTTSPLTPLLRKGEGNGGEMLRVESREEGEDDARSACPFDTLGYTRDTMAHYNATQYRKVEQIVIKVA